MWWIYKHDIFTPVLNLPLSPSWPLPLKQLHIWLSVLAFLRQKTLTMTHSQGLKCFKYCQVHSEKLFTHKVAPASTHTVCNMSLSCQGKTVSSFQTPQLCAARNPKMPTCMQPSVLEKHHNVSCNCPLSVMLRWAVHLLLWGTLTEHWQWCFFASLL